MRLWLFLSFLLCVHVELVFADGEQVCEAENGCAAESQEGSKRTELPKLDRRLPPVLPGQVVEVDGQKIKVWSSSGPVPVDRSRRAREEHERRKYEDLTGEVNVIVDQREKPRRPRSRPSSAKPGTPR
ncbi:MAG: hypothetical protein GX589_08135 [Deltaproteobacteria bacterium]|nr:hypothetical protein [Deltaproteobacteria bacterium]